MYNMYVCTTCTYVQHVCMYNIYVCTYLSVISTSALESFRTTSHTIACTLWIAIPFDTHRSPIYVRNLDIKGNVTSHNFKMVLKIEQCSVRIDTCLLYTYVRNTDCTYCVCRNLWRIFNFAKDCIRHVQFPMQNLCQGHFWLYYIYSLLWKTVEFKPAYMYTLISHVKKLVDSFMVKYPAREANFLLQNIVCKKRYFFSRLLRKRSTNVWISFLWMCFSSSLLLFLTRAAIVSSARTSKPIWLCISDRYLLAISSCARRRERGEGERGRSRRGSDWGVGEVPRLTTYALQDTHIHLAFWLDSEYIHKKEKGGKKGEAGEGGREGGWGCFIWKYTHY